MRSIDTFYNIERDEFVQVVDFKSRTIRTILWNEYWELENEDWIKRLPFREELIAKDKLRKDYFDIHNISKPYGMNFWKFLIAENLKEDFREYETECYRNAILKWFEQNNLFSRLKMDIYIFDN